MSDGDVVPRDRVALAVVAVVVLAVAARLVGLGARPFHWGEGRVGYWTLRYLETGVYSYRPVAGGPFLYLVNRWVFALLGATDATARLVVALVGGLLPAAALLFRRSLADDETVALAVVLAGSPLLVYYSRFLRGDVPAAAFGFVTVGALVRHRDTGGRRPLYLAAAAFALALASSGFAVAYPFVWLAAAGFVLDEARVAGVPAAAVARVERGVAWARANATPLARAFFVFAGVALLAFAPRGGGTEVGLWNPATLPAAVEFAFVGAAERFLSLRVAYRLSPTNPGGRSFIPAVAGLARTLVVAGWPALVLGLVGFALDRYGGRPRGVVAFGGYVTGLGLVAFAVASMGSEPWVAVHLLPFLALPAAVGLARVGRTVRARVSAADPGLAVAVLLLASAGVAGYGAAAAGVYAAPAPDSPYAQFAQPADDPDAMLAAARPVVAANDDGPDVVYVGARLDTRREYALPPVEADDRDAWGARLPLQWYFERLDAEVDSVAAAGVLAGRSPPVVVTTPGNRVAVSETLSGYESFDLRLGLTDRTVVVFVRETA